MKKTVMGILAHVDSGKTTLSESLLYMCGSIKKQGRVDWGNTAMDTEDIERERGITVFSNRAKLVCGDLEMYIVDTPGHVDFGAEAERTLNVLDCATIIISSLDGIQSHTVTLWKLLRDYNIPTYIFVNKMDLDGADKNVIMRQIVAEFGGGCIDFSGDIDREEIAGNDENAIEEYLTTGFLCDETIADLIEKRKIFPVLFGSALKNTGVIEYLSVVEKSTREKTFNKEFGAKVYKIGYDGGKRITYLKVTGGSLTVKNSITQTDKNRESHTEKVNEIRQYTGEKYTNLQTVDAGSLCAVTGLNYTYRGQGLGCENNNGNTQIQSVFTYKVLFDRSKHDVRNVLMNLRKLEEEEPELRITWDERSKVIHLSLMGEIQLEIIKSIFFQRYGVELSFDAGSVLYKETITNTVEGVGHYEPLRHYAEVHLLCEPLPLNSGLVFDSECSEDELDRNWQRLILTHLAEKQHIGVLTGSPITDMKITLVKGKAHLKHTEGGDFRQATYRAVRNGLMQANSVLLEPFYGFEINVPNENIGRVIADIQRMSGEFSDPVSTGSNTTLSGVVPVSEIAGYNSELLNYTHGKGKISLKFKGYDICHNSDAVIESIGYSAESDIENTRDSVFCSHGAGHVVKWNEVASYMHLDSYFKSKNDSDSDEIIKDKRRRALEYRQTLERDKELMRIFEATYGKIDKNRYINSYSEKIINAKHDDVVLHTPNKKVAADDYLLVDGYNIIHSWDDLREIATSNFANARKALTDRLCNYRGFKRCKLILVFDAYKVKNNPGEIYKYHNITIVYTKERETADMYIEKVTKEIGKKHNVRVATSDGLEQMIILGHGALRMSANALLSEVIETEKDIAEFINS